MRKVTIILVSYSRREMSSHFQGLSLFHGGSAVIALECQKSYLSGRAHTKRSGDNSLSAIHACRTSFSTLVVIFFLLLPLANESGSSTYVCKAKNCLFKITCENSRSLQMEQYQNSQMFSYWRRKTQQNKL